MVTRPSVIESELREEFRDGWSLIHTDADRWLAFRRPGHGLPSDAVTEIEAKTLDELAERLREADR